MSPAGPVRWLAKEEARRQKESKCYLGKRVLSPCCLQSRLVLGICQEWLLPESTHIQEGWPAEKGGLSVLGGEQREVASSRTGTLEDASGPGQHARCRSQ